MIKMHNIHPCRTKCIFLHLIFSATGESDGQPESTPTEFIAQYKHADRFKVGLDCVVRGIFWKRYRLCKRKRERRGEKVFSNDI